MPVGGGDNLEKDAQKRDYGNAIVLSKFELDDPQRFRFIEYVGISRRVSSCIPTKANISESMRGSTQRPMCLL